MTQNETATELINRIGPMFNEHEPEVIGSVLAMLTAHWVASHYTDDDEAELHRQLLDSHLRVISSLVAQRRAQLVAAFH